MINIYAKALVLQIILILAAPLSSFGQQKEFSITGCVIDKANQQVLSGVNISVAGSRMGTVTNKEGKFEIHLKNAPAVLYFSYLGYAIRVIQINESTSRNIVVELQPETIEFNEITISSEAIQKVTRGDSLYVADYEIIGDKMVLVAYPYKRPRLQRLYLANLNGDIISIREIKRAGKEIQYPEKPFPVKSYFFKDCFNQVHLLTKDRVWQILIKKNQVFCLYPSRYEDFLGYLFPMKYELGGNLFYQVSTRVDNETCIINANGEKSSIKVVHDPIGSSRYMFARNVSAPIIKKDSIIAIFDFFDNHLELFDSNGISKSRIPISFHLHKVTPILQKEYYDLDHLNFKQEVIIDVITGKSYAIWRNKRTSRFSLHQINMSTGGISLVIEIPGFPNISKIRCNNDIVYFMYLTKYAPYYHTIYRMRMQ